MEKKIMIVDDAMFMRKVIRKNLETAGYSDIVEAGDGEKALELYWEEHPHLTLLDITMPGKSGIQVLEEIKSKDPGANIVMCSAIGQDNMIVEAISKGALDFIVKPFKTEELIRVVDHVLK